MSFVEIGEAGDVDGGEGAGGADDDQVDGAIGNVWKIGEFGRSTRTSGAFVEVKRMAVTVGAFVLDGEIDLAGAGGLFGIVGDVHQVIEKGDGACAGEIGLSEEERSAAEREPRGFGSADNSDLSAEHAGRARDLCAHGHEGFDIEMFEINLEQGLIDVVTMFGDASPGSANDAEGEFDLGGAGGGIVENESVGAEKCGGLEVAEVKIFEIDAVGLDLNIDCDGSECARISGGVDAERAIAFAGEGCEGGGEGFEGGEVEIFPIEVEARGFEGVVEVEETGTGGERLPPRVWISILGASI